MIQTIRLKKMKKPFDRDRYNLQAKGKFIAVDYDDTITLYAPYPQKGELNLEAKEYLLKLHEAGFKLILWTARTGDAYEEAYDRCINEFGLPLLRDSDEFVHGDSGKLVASFYIDDKSYPDGKIEWKKIYKYLITKFKEI